MSRVGSPRAARFLVVLAWALATVLAGSVIWWAVAAIGGEAGVARSGVLTESQVAALAAQATASTAGSTPSGTAGPTPAPSTPPSTGPGPSPSAGAQASPSAGPVLPPPATQAPTATKVARTWDVPGGQVGAACTGSRIDLLYATPQDGWTVEVKHAGPEEVEVELRRAESETTVRAACRDGVPEMRTDAAED